MKAGNSHEMTVCGKAIASVCFLKSPGFGRCQSLLMTLIVQYKWVLHRVRVERSKMMHGIYR